MKDTVYISYTNDNDGNYVVNLPKGETNPHKYTFAWEAFQMIANEYFTFACDKREDCISIGLTARNSGIKKLIGELVVLGLNVQWK